METELTFVELGTVVLTATEVDGKAVVVLWVDETKAVVELKEEVVLCKVEVGNTVGTDEVVDSAEEVETTDEVFVSAEEVDTTMADVLDSTDEVLDSVEEVLDSTDEVLDSTDEVLDTTEEVEVLDCTEDVDGVAEDVDEEELLEVDVEVLLEDDDELLEDEDEELEELEMATFLTLKELQVDLKLDQAVETSSSQTEFRQE